MAGQLMESYKDSNMSLEKAVAGSFWACWMFLILAAQHQSPFTPLLQFPPELAVFSFDSNITW